MNVDETWTSAGGRANALPYSPCRHPLDEINISEYFKVACNVSRMNGESSERVLGLGLFQVLKMCLNFFVEMCLAFT